MVFGYIDPGAGSMVIQALIAVIIGLPILFRRQVARIGPFFRRPNRPGPASHDEVESA